MAEAQIKVALNALANAGVEIREHDENGRDVGDVTELAPGKSATFSLKEGCSVVAVPGAAVEGPKDKQTVDPVLTLSVESDSTSAAKGELTTGISGVSTKTVDSSKSETFILGNESRLRITRGGRNEARSPKVGKKAAA